MRLFFGVFSINCKSYWQLYLIELLKAFNRTGASQVVVLDDPKLLTRFWMLVFFINLKSHRIWRQIFGPISSFLINKQFQVVLDGKSSQEYWVNSGVWWGIWSVSTTRIELESDLRDTLDWERKWLLNFNAGKLNWFRLTCLITLKLLMWKTGLFLRKYHLLRSCGWLSLLNWIGAICYLCY